MKGQRFILAAVLAVASTATWAADGSAEAAKQKISMCVGCHGIPGYRTAFPSVYHVPKIGGQHPDYIVAALMAYKDGTRSHPTMQGIAASLSDQDMADLAAYYGSAQ
ncbi:c-type cytochrome [Nitrogeniibacter aestuarii]|uniref:c-type cytochrome n=1 Tax=Nitrogeniibacter aestuarii TaxID=2815343 RepID=UPI001D127239|nr:cytochrome c [Nitrogeniibacter aestuarii]